MKIIIGLGNQEKNMNLPDTISVDLNKKKRG